MTHYSRPTYIHYASELQRGDLVDVSTTLTPYWATVERVGTCADDTDADCDGACMAVLFFLDPDDGTYHVGEADDLYARLTAQDTPADIDAVNDAHTAKAAFRSPTHHP